MTSKGWPFLAVAAFFLIAGGVKMAADGKSETETAVALACGCVLLGVWIVVEVWQRRDGRDNDNAE